MQTSHTRKTPFTIVCIPDRVLCMPFDFCPVVNPTPHQIQEISTLDKSTVKLFEKHRTRSSTWQISPCDHSPACRQNLPMHQIQKTWTQISLETLFCGSSFILLRSHHLKWPIIKVFMIRSLHRFHPVTCLIPKVHTSSLWLGSSTC